MVLKRNVVEYVMRTSTWDLFRVYVWRCVHVLKKGVCNMRTSCYLDRMETYGSYLTFVKRFLAPVCAECLTHHGLPAEADLLLRMDSDEWPNYLDEFIKFCVDPYQQMSNSLAPLEDRSLYGRRYPFSLDLHRLDMRLRQPCCAFQATSLLTAKARVMYDRWIAAKRRHPTILQGKEYKSCKTYLIY